MAKGKRKRSALQKIVELYGELEHIALGEEVREEFEVLDKQGVPLPEQPAPSTAGEIEARKIEQFKKLVSADKRLRQSIPPDLLEILEGDEPPATGSRSTRALGFVHAIAAEAEKRSRLVRKGLEQNPKTDDQVLREKLIAALSEIKLPTGSRQKADLARKHLQAKHPDLWNFKTPRSGVVVRHRTKGGWFREIMLDSQRRRERGTRGRPNPHLPT